MRRWGLDELKPFWRQLESLSDATPDADVWCSSPDWVFPVHSAFAPESEPILLGDPEEGMALLAKYVTDDVTAIGGLEPLWGFASPAVGANHFDVLVDAFTVLSNDQSWSHAVLPAIPLHRETILSLAARLEYLGEIGLSEGITCQVADLSQGPNGWHDRRSRRFRNQLRTAEASAFEAGITFETTTEKAGLFDRLLSIEERSWKGKVSDGITSPSMSAFYREVIERLGDRSRLHATIARLDGIDVGFIFGGVRDGRYRGLQLSYAEEVHALSLGHLLQLHEIERLPVEAGVHTYDLGMDMEYKRRWADSASSSVTLVIRRR